MIHVEPFEYQHVSRMRLQPQQQADLEYASPKYLQALGLGGPSFTLFEADSPLLCTGLHLGADSIGRLWGFFSSDAGPHFVVLYRAARRLLALYPCPMEASVRVGFSPGCRWLSMLGFERLERLQGFGHDGSDHWRYARST
jgi:hypothetical protein